MEGKGRGIEPGGKEKEGVAGKGEGPTSTGRGGDVKGGERGKGREKGGEAKGEGKSAGCADVKTP